jgi:pimeloyl-[acyl-carrier protein] methyl ester esterase
VRRTGGFSSIAKARGKVKSASEVFTPGREGLNGVHREIVGQGPDVVLFHGWGMNSAIWRDFAVSLAADFRVHLFDLPGHGQSGYYAEFQMDDMRAALGEVLPPNAHWLGWSLGGLIALGLAGFPEFRARSVCLVASNGKFLASQDWPCGMEPSLMHQFGVELMANPREHLLKFLGLQLWGLENARGLLKILRERLAHQPTPDPFALRGGLHLLEHGDVRPLLAEMNIPVLLLLGGRDRLVPVASGKAMQALSPGLELQVLESAAHMPFLSHGQECRRLLRDFWKRQDSGRFE